MFFLLPNTGSDAHNYLLSYFFQAGDRGLWWPWLPEPARLRVQHCLTSRQSHRDFLPPTPEHFCSCDWWIAFLVGSLILWFLYIPYRYLSVPARTVGATRNKKVQPYWFRTVTGKDDKISPSWALLSTVPDFFWYQLLMQPLKNNKFFSSCRWNSAGMNQRYNNSRFVYLLPGI